MLTRAAVLTLGMLFLRAPSSAIAQAHARQSNAVPRQILEEIRKDKSWQPRVERFRDSLPYLLVAEPVDLNGDGVPELVIRGQGRICEANNCEVWIYGRTSSGYARLLGDEIVQEVEPLRTTSHGYRDVRTWHHGSAFQSDVTLYKFDGRRYRNVQCLDYTYGYRDSHDQWHDSKRPRITPQPCPPED